MTGEDLIDSMGYVDPQLIEEAECPMPVKKKRWIPVAAVAACAAIVITLLLPWRGRIMVLSAKDVAAMLEDHNSAGETNQYTTVYASGSQDLRANPLPKGWLLPVYLQKTQMLSEDESELHQWKAQIDRRLPNYLDFGRSGTVRLKDHDNAMEYRLIRTWDEEEQGLYGIICDGKQISIDHTQTDQQILESLEWVKEKLFALFEVDLPDAKVVRSYGGDTQYGAYDVDIYYYDGSEHPLDQLGSVPVTDRIRISFDNYENYEGDLVSADTLIDVSIVYTKYLASVQKRYPTVGWGKRISLQKAEELLEKGYVFIDSDCPACTAAQKPLDLSDYDHVSFEYVREEYRDGKKNFMMLPFYAFYKKIGMTPGGAEIYAKTYVCAIELTGMEDHFGNHSHD